MIRDLEVKKQVRCDQCGYKKDCVYYDFGSELCYSCLHEGIKILIPENDILKLKIKINQLEEELKEVRRKYWYETEGGG